MTEVTLPKPNTTKPAFYRLLVRMLRLTISTRPEFYNAYARASGLQFRLNDSTQILVDSYPRSANSFFEAAFTRAHRGRVAVAHHSHAAAQVLAGVRRGLPCIVLLREPEGAIASFYEMNGGHYPVWLCSQEYIAFYGALEPVCDKLLVVATETVESRFFDLMVMLRDRYNLPVEPYEIDGKIRAELFGDVDATGRARNGFRTERYSETLSGEEKARRRARLEAIREIVQAPSNQHRLARARALHQRLRRHAF